MSKYFKSNEAGLDGGRYERLKPELLTKLDELRELYGKPITITSSYRGPDHPIEAAKETGPGVHSTGAAVDIAAVGGTETLELVRASLAVGFQRIGISRKKNFVHLDIADITEMKTKSIWTY